jgi:hypothetical protein
MKAQESLQALSEGAHNALKGYDAMPYRKDELFATTARLLYGELKE